MFSTTSTLSTEQSKLMNQCVSNLLIICQLLKSGEKFFLGPDPELRQNLSDLIMWIRPRRKHYLSMLRGTAVCQCTFPG